MVKARTIALLLALLPLTSVAQHYYITDTVTEHNNFGTFYHDRFEGRKTASGEVFDQNKFTAAHWKIKLGTLVMVTNRNTGLQVIVKVNDRCPKHNVLDMTHRAANAIGIKGCQKVTVRILPEGYEERWAAQETMFDSVHTRLGTGTAAKAKNNSPAPTRTATTTTDRYNLLLGVAGSHSDVYTQTRRLPAAYRDLVNVEALEGSDSLRITLDVKCPKNEAEKLSRTLRNTFPKVQIIPAE